MAGNTQHVKPALAGRCQRTVRFLPCQLLHINGYFEDTLLTSDLGVGPTTELVSALRSRLRVDGVSDPAQAREILRSELVRLVDPTLDRTVHVDRGDVPAVSTSVRSYSSKSLASISESSPLQCSTTSQPAAITSHARCA